MDTNYLSSQGSKDGPFLRPGDPSAFRLSPFRGHKSTPLGTSEFKLGFCCPSQETDIPHQGLASPSSGTTLWMGPEPQDRALHVRMSQTMEVEVWPPAPIL